MKKITVILTAFVLILAIQSNAQEGLPVERNTDQLELDHNTRNINRARKGNRHKALRRSAVRRKVDRGQLRAMRRVARADGTISPRERSVIRQERRQLKRRNKRAMNRRAIRHNQRLQRQSNNW